MLACCAFAIVLLIPFLTAWRRLRGAWRRIVGLPPDPNNAPVAWRPGESPDAPSLPRRPARALLLAALGGVALSGALAGDVSRPSLTDTINSNPFDFICRTLP